MRVLGREQITAQPKSQSVAAGKIVLANDGDTFTFWGSVQPIGTKQLERLPEGARTSARWIIYPEKRIAAINFDPPADRLTTSKGILVPVGEIDLSLHTSGLPHVALACAEVGADE